MENLIFSLNATLPIFFIMILGWLFRKVGLMDAVFVKKMNRFVFQAALPALVFQDLATADFFQVWDTRFVIFCFTATLVSILAVTAVSFLLRDKGDQGEFIQASYRSSAAILGIAFYPKYIWGCRDGSFDDHCYGTALQCDGGGGTLCGEAREGEDECSSPDRHAERDCNQSHYIGNSGRYDLVLAEAAHAPCSGENGGIRGCLGNPLGLMAMGASFEWKQATSKLGPAAAASTIKLVALAAIFLPIAVKMGFTNENWWQYWSCWGPQPL